jgi:hypothetical protein
MEEVLLLEPVPHAAMLPGSDVLAPKLIPPPSYVVLEPAIGDDMLKPDIPDDMPTPDIALDELPAARQVVPPPGIPIVPLGSGLRPGDPSSVAPKGTPVGETGEPGPRPSGEVAPMLGIVLPIPPACAKAGPQPRTIAIVETITNRVI